MSTIKQISIYNAQDGSWSIPVDLGADAENVKYKDISSVEAMLQSFDEHKQNLIYTEEGVHGLRYYTNKLQYWNGLNWNSIIEGGGEASLPDVIGAAITTKKNTAIITWTDPNDIESLSVEWAGTLVVRKEGAAPTSISDGIIVIDSTVKNQYSSNGYVDTGLEYGTVYYYRFFPYQEREGLKKYIFGSSISVMPQKITLFNKPTPRTNLIYTGVNQTQDWNYYNPEELELTGVTSAIQVGQYTATFTPKDGYQWENGDTSSYNVDWHISSIEVPIPTSLNDDLIYNGEQQGPIISEYNPAIISATGTMQAINAGTYYIYFSLKDPNITWENGGKSDVTLIWQIQQKELEIPYITEDSFVFDGTVKRPTIHLLSDEVIVEGTTEAVSVGTYFIEFNLPGYPLIENHKWKDGSYSNFKYYWSINPAEIELPTLSGTYIYNGTEQTVTESPYDNKKIARVGNNTGVNAGTYTIKYIIEGRDTPEYVWSDTKTNEDREVTWSILPKPIDIPVMGEPQNYDGSQKNAPIGNYDNNEIVVTGTQTAINAGTYTVYYDLVDTANYIWNGGGITQKSANWIINKAPGNVNLSNDKITITNESLQETVTLSGATGNVTLGNTHNPSIATVDMLNNEITITGINAGTTTITVNVAESTNYNAMSKTIIVRVLPFIDIVTFADGTDEQIKAMLDAYYADQITWGEMGWEVGDTRVIHFNSMLAPEPNNNGSIWEPQDITVVIVSYEHTELAVPINGHTKACITVQTREVMSGEASSDTGSHIYINGDSAADKTFTKWADLYMRNYLNNTVLNAIPTSPFKSAIKQSKHYRHTNYRDSNSEQVVDTLFLPSYPEIFGTLYDSYYNTTNPEEGERFAYYSISANRIKYVNNRNGASNGIKKSWWTSSPCSYYDTDLGYFWNLISGGGILVYAGGECGLAPAFAM